MKLLQSKRFRLPKVYFISDRAEIEELPVGVPFIFGDESIEEDMIRILEYEVLYQEASKSGYPFDFRKILRDNGFLDIENYSFSHPVYMEFNTDGKGGSVGGDVSPSDFCDLSKGKGKSAFKQFIKDGAVYVDVQKLKALNVFPIWLDSIEKAIHTNVHNFAVYNENMYNKKLEGMYGSLELTSPGKNLIIIDISGSIPKGVSSTCLALSKNLAESFYCDLLITGSKSTLYPYEEMHALNINTIYDENGMDNDQVYFKKLVTGDDRKYKTAIVFGDNHSPCQTWHNSYNSGTKSISRETGQKMCRWKIDKLISFHTDGVGYTAGYADWFTPAEVEKIGDWLKYL